MFVWQDGPRAYLVASDNIELTDVDIFDITDPTDPGAWWATIDLVDLFPEILDGEQSNGGAVFHHDMVVKQIDGKPILMADYWDAGYVQLDVTDPAEPDARQRHDVRGRGSALPGSDLTPEGNGHQGEFSHDNQFLLAADEDFGAFRYVVRATGGPTAGRAARPGPRRQRRGPDRRAARRGAERAVDGSWATAATRPTVPAAPADDGDPNTDDIALVERGGPLPDGTDRTCGFANKFDNVRGGRLGRHRSSSTRSVPTTAR